MSDSIV